MCYSGNSSRTPPSFDAGSAMPPKKAPPLRQCKQMPRRCPDEDAPVRFVTLQLYRVNGEFVMELIQSGGQNICRLIMDLEDGYITSALQLGRWDNLSGPCYQLVFNDLVLDETRSWEQAVDEYGMSFTEINIITVVRVPIPESPCNDT